MNSLHYQVLTSIEDVWTIINSLYMIYCTSLLPLAMIGIALFYSGLTQRRSSLTMLALPVFLTPFILIEWFIWGYSLCYSSSSNHFIGDLNFAVLRHMRDSVTNNYNTPRGEIWLINHFLFNGFMKVICVCLTFPGCIAERGRILPMVVFLFFWSVIIYNPVTYWFWNREGWLSVELNSLPVLDFAGGNCVHIVSGFTALAYSYILGPRNPKILYDYRSTNTGYIIIGTFFMICGWCGFVAGCDYKFTIECLYIILNVLLCASTSGIIWMLIDYYFSAIPLEGAPIESALSNHRDKIHVLRISSTNIRTIPSVTGASINQHYHDTKSNFVQRRKISIISFSSGIVTGLAVITPGGGYVSSPTDFWKSFVFGVLGGIIVNLSTRLKYFVQIDDALDIFAIHGVAGILGSLLTGIFANQRYNSKGGWVKGHWIQLGYQLLGCTVTAAYVFVLSCVFLYCIDLIPGLHLRMDKTFNQRMREERERVQAESTESPTSVDIEEQFVPHNTNEITYLEKLELLGTDCYEFNGEYFMDFMEFIKVIRPQDYPFDQFTEETETQYDSVNAIGSDYQLHPEGVNHLARKGE